MADFTLDIDWLANATTTATTSRLTVTAAYQQSNDGYTAAVTTSSSKWLNKAIGAVSWNSTKWSAGATYYKMRGMDQLTNGLYATWVVTGAPDYAAGSYVGGLNLPLRDVHVIDTWTGT